MPDNKQSGGAINIHLKELFAGSSVAFIFRILGIAAGYIFIYIASHYYGPKGLGIYSLALSVLAILEIFGMIGFDTSILRFVGHYHGENKHHKIRPLYTNTVIRFVLPVSCFLALGLFFSSHLLL